MLKRAPQILFPGELCSAVGLFMFQGFLCSIFTPHMNSSCSALEMITGQGSFRIKHCGQAKGKNGTRRMAGKRLKKRETA